MAEVGEVVAVQLGDAVVCGNENICLKQETYLANAQVIFLPDMSFFAI